MVDAARATQSPNTNVKGRVRYNPIAHLVNGTQRLFKVNASSGLLAIVIASLVNLVLAAAIFATLFVSLSDIIRPNEQALASFLVKILVAGVVIAVITGYFSSVVGRLILASAKGQKESLAAAMKLVWKRLPKIVLTYLALFGIVLVAGVILGFASASIPAVGIILTLAAVVLGIIWVFRLVFISFILVDNEEVAGPKQVFARSAQLWKKSGGAVMLYILLTIVASAIFSGVTGGFSTNSSTKSNLTTADFSNTTSLESDTADTFDEAAFQAELNKALKEESGVGESAGLFALMGSMFVSVFLGNLFSALGTAGLASIYTDARKVHGDKQATSAAAAAPVAPTAS